MYAPVVRFNCPDGRAVEFNDEISSSRPAYRVGERVRVLYRRRDPGDARVASPYKLSASEVIFACFGALFTAVGGVLVYAFAFGWNLPAARPAYSPAPLRLPAVPPSTP